MRAGVGGWCDMRRLLVGCGRLVLGCGRSMISPTWGLREMNGLHVGWGFRTAGGRPYGIVDDKKWRGNLELGVVE